jgi:NADH dehydrogenase FAD-containing subunit
MASILVLGGGFGGVVAAESLARLVSKQHQVTLISRNRTFVFYPDLVRLAFGKSEPDDISFDLRDALFERGVGFLQGEVARIYPEEQSVTIAHGEVQGKMPYDYLVVALGRRLATEQVTGFFEHAGHLLNVKAALELGDKIKGFKGGRAVLGQCPGARLPVPVYETAFALAKLVKQQGLTDASRITIVSPDSPNLQFSDLNIAVALRDALEKHSIEFIPDFRISRVTGRSVITNTGDSLDYSLLMLVPPFRGPGAVNNLGITNEDGYIEVDNSMRVRGLERVYAVGDCVNFPGPKLGHMAVNQAEVAANNLAAELRGELPGATYNHDMMLVIDEGGEDTIYLHKGRWIDEKAQVKKGRFWSWAKRVHQKHWVAHHS